LSQFSTFSGDLGTILRIYAHFCAILEQPKLPKTADRKHPDFAVNEKKARLRAGLKEVDEKQYEESYVVGHPHIRNNNCLVRRKTLFLADTHKSANPTAKTITQPMPHLRQISPMLRWNNIMIMSRPNYWPPLVKSFCLLIHSSLLIFKADIKHSIITTENNLHGASIKSTINSKS
jgi:hypothetical protein